MAAGENLATYRLHAAHCMEIAANTADIKNKLTLLDMARAWLLLAEQAEKNSETFVVYEAPTPSREA
jgi:hypothetical protein